ncbi:AimR family lysis-lysogeny pheromone receptor [Virgibacillus xinjiangensis]|uniref:AimR family lysis-lysogeny pheromone receptor n=1 Tax=Virgibacillus xinjiangensis TaxID=393090 RepID=A0ABV7CVH2_9BACI
MVKSSLTLRPEDVQYFQEHIQMLKETDDTQPILLAIRTKCLNENDSLLLKVGLEYIYINGFYKDMDEMIQKNRETGIPSNIQWAEVYQLMMDAVHQVKSPHLILQQAGRLQTEEPELICLLEYVKLHAHINMNKYSEFGNFLNQYQYYLEEVEDRLLKYAFRIRLYSLLLFYHLMRNEVLMARKFGYRLLQQTFNDKTKVNAHMKLGLSYTFESYEQGMLHLREALKLAEKQELHQRIYEIRHNNIPFLAAHYGRPEGITTEDKAEQAHLEIAKGNNDKAIDILNSLDEETPFSVYYLGKAKQDREILLRAYRMFIRDRRDFFFSRLSLQAIRELDL